MIDRAAFRALLVLAWLGLAASLRAQLSPGAIGGIIGGSMPYHMLAARFGPVHRTQVTADTSRIDLAILDRMQTRLGTDLTLASMSSRCYERHAFGQLAYRYCFDFALIQAAKDTVFTEAHPWRPESLSLKPNLALLRYGFKASTGDDMGADSYNLAVFLNSAYHQELYPRYGKVDSLFLALPTKTQGGLWARGAVSMGWMMGYAVEANPFMTSGAVPILKVLLYGFDALAYVGMAAAAFQADSFDEGVQGALLVKAAHAGLSWGIFTPLMSVELGETLRIRRSGYRLPVTLRLRW